MSPSKARKKIVSINLRVISAVCASVLSRLSKLCKRKETLHYTENIFNMSVSKGQEQPLCAIFVLGFSVTKRHFLSSHVCCKCATISLRKETKRLEIGPAIVEKTISDIFAVFGCWMPLITDKSATRSSTRNLFFFF